MAETSPVRASPVTGSARISAGVAVTNSVGEQPMFQVLELVVEDAGVLP